MADWSWNDILQGDGVVDGIAEFAARYQRIESPTEPSEPQPGPEPNGGGNMVDHKENALLIVQQTVFLKDIVRETFGERFKALADLTLAQIDPYLAEIQRLANEIVASADPPA